MENSEFKPVKLRLKIDLVSYPARAEGLVNMDITIFKSKKNSALSAGAVENTDCISAGNISSTSVLDITLNNLIGRIQ